jgi:hypothetical protein
MSTGTQKRQRKRSTRVRRTSDPVPTTRGFGEDSPTDDAAREHYRREKERRASRVRTPEHPLEQARRAYQALLAADAERARGGRPKKMVTPTAPRPQSAEPEAGREE